MNLGGVDFNNNKNKKMILFVLIVLILILMSFGIYNFINKDSNLFDIDIYEQTQKEDGIKIEDEALIIDEDSNRDLQEEVQVLNLKYDDAIGWLKISGTSIDFPIFQSTNNSRYLRNDRDNKNTGWGETFLDYRVGIDKINEPNNYIIYGHNTEEDTCFTPLLKYKEKDFLEENNIIEFSTLDGNYKWEIFSVYQTTTDFYYIDTTFSTPEIYQQFLNGLVNKSIYNTEVEVTSEDTILTLSTCDYYVKDIGRFVVQAKLIK